jgi:hypothetical protein
MFIFYLYAYYKRLKLDCDKYTARRSKREEKRKKG